MDKISPRELSAERRAQLLDNGIQGTLFGQNDSTGYREASAFSESYPFKPLCDEDHTTDA